MEWLFSRIEWQRCGSLSRSALASARRPALAFGCVSTRLWQTRCTRCSWDTGTIITISEFPLPQFEGCIDVESVACQAVGLFDCATINVDVKHMSRGFVGRVDLVTDGAPLLVTL